MTKNTKKFALVLLVLFVVSSAHPTNRATAYLKPRDLESLERLFYEVSDPSINNQQYGKFLTADALSALVGHSSSSIQKVVTWLESKGGTDIVVDASNSVSVNLPTSAAVTLHSDGVFHDGPAIVNFVTSSVANIHAGKDHLRRHRFKATSSSAGNSADPNSQRAAMGIPYGLVGTNPKNLQLVWGTGTYGAQASDLTSFWSSNQIQLENISMISYQGTLGTSGDNYGEGCLDTEYLTSIAPGVATIVSNTDSSSGAEYGLAFGRSLLSFVNNLATNPVVPYVFSLSLGSLSFASCDRMCRLIEPQFAYSDCWTYLTTTQRQVCMFESQALVDSISTGIMQLGLRGVSVLGSSGDGGSHWSFQPFTDNTPISNALNVVGCAYNWPIFPGDSPYITTVGGTDQISSQIPWAASGGGFSWNFVQPAYQAAMVNTYLTSSAKTSNMWPASSAFNASNRAYPDVAAYAGSAPMTEGGMPNDASGTSESAPVFAGVISLINDARLNAGLPPLGFLNPRIYSIAAQHPNEAFVVASAGSSCCDSSGSCCATGFPIVAGPNWNPVTGLGWPIFGGMMKYMASSP